MYLQRTLDFYLKQVDKQFPVLLVTGPRQVGKTTLLRHLSHKIRTYVTLDNPNHAQLAREEPELFLQRFQAPILIDEVQYAPELLPYIKMHVDEQHQSGEYWLTGSQQFHLMRGISETLAGRAGIVNLLGLSLKEIQGHPQVAEPFLPIASQLKMRAKHSPQLSLNEIYEIIWRGSFPAVITQNLDRDLFYSSYVQTYLQRDVRDLANVGDASIFLKFLRAAAARTGQLLNLSEIARDTGITPSTARSWLSILETSGIIYLLEPYHNNITKRMIKTPKLYFLDTGLCAYLTEWSTPGTLEAGAMSGAILETFIFTEILKSYWHNGKRAPIYYYRDKDKKEIDLLIVKDDIIYPLEFKKTARADKQLIKSFDVLKKLGKEIGEGGLISLVSTLLPLTESTHAIPVGLL
ncbi:MAG TPA: ATP-binding protein [Gammaproteobacteria bacterium]|jgi:predicted AAA+ superfamily ATPase|nr:ATP-binding protein [Gammaproteobacteria bacterium]